MKWFAVVTDESGIEHTVRDGIRAVYESRLSANGMFSLSVPASARHASILQLDRKVRLYVVINKKVVRLGGGFLQEVDKDVTGRRITVSGDGLLTPLYWKQLRHFAIFDMVTIPITNDTGLVFEDSDATPQSEAIVPNLPYQFTMLETDLTRHRYVYVGHHSPFDQFAPTFSAFNTRNSTLYGEYVGIDDEGRPDFKAVTITDGTASGGAPFAQNGIVTWSIPADWTPILHNGQERFWLRCYVDGDLDPVTLVSATIRIRGRKSNDVQHVFSQVAGWSLDSAGYMGTTGGTFFPSLHAVSAMTALSEIHHRTGEHFRESENDNQAEWIGNDKSVSLIVPMQHGDPQKIAANSDRALIADIRIVERSSDRITRLFVEGAGNGAAALTLALATDSYPGIGISYTNSSVEIAGAPTVIEGSAFFDDITSDSGHDTVEAANQLLAAAVAELGRRSQNYLSLAIELSGLSGLLKVGDMLSVKYRGSGGDGVWIDVDGLFHILRVQHSLSDTLRAAVQVANVPRHSRSPELIVESMERAERRRRTAQPQHYKNLIGFGRTVGD